MFDVVGATRRTENGQPSPQIIGVTPGCCWVKSAHAAIGAPLESAETSLRIAIRRTRRNKQAANFIMAMMCVNTVSYTA